MVSNARKVFIIHDYVSTVIKRKINKTPFIIKTIHTNKQMPSPNIHLTGLLNVKYI